MDDYSINSLIESKNEVCARLVNILYPSIIQGLKSIFSEAWKLCSSNDEEDKYLMTFQTFLTRVPKWNPTIIDDERKRICETTGCGHLEDLVTCVHIIQLKALTCVRVGQKQKKVDITIPPINDFIHKVYINVARKCYTNIYLFEKNIQPLQIQKNNRELENIIKECILNSVRESIPIETILRAYMDETEEQDIEVKEVIEQIKEKEVGKIAEQSAGATALAQQSAGAANDANALAQQSAGAGAIKTNITTENMGLGDLNANSNKITFSDNDFMQAVNGSVDKVYVPKTDEFLAAKELSNSNDDDGGEDSLKIGGDIKLDISDISDLSIKSTKFNDLPPPILDCIEVLG
jgi:hypothetical protein